MAERKTSPPEEPQNPETEEKPETGKPVARKAPAKKAPAKKTAPKKRETKKAAAGKNDNPQADGKPKRKPSPVNGVTLPEGKMFKRGEEQRELARMAGKKSGEVRRARKTLRQELLDLLEVKTKDSTGKEQTRQESMSLAILLKAMKGDVRAYETIRDTIGEKPKEEHSVELAVPKFEKLDEAFTKMSGDPQ